MPKTNDLLLLEEVAAEVRAPLSSVRFWVATGKLRSLRPGRRRLVRRLDLDFFLHGPGVSGPSSASDRRQGSIVTNPTAGKALPMKPNADSSSPIVVVPVAVTAGPARSAGFDMAAIRLSSEYASTVGVRSVLNMVPVRKPTKT
jgi:excisionase family DNA binding protein